MCEKIIEKCEMVSCGIIVERMFRVGVIGNFICDVSYKKRNIGRKKKLVEGVVYKKIKI